MEKRPARKLTLQARYSGRKTPKICPIENCEGNELYADLRQHRLMYHQLENKDGINGLMSLAERSNEKSARLKPNGERNAKKCLR